MKEKFEHIINELIDQYLYADDSNRPWIIGFSGGKDSTVLLQLVWEALSRIKVFSGTRNIYVVSNDTMIENPLIAAYQKKILKKIEIAAVRQDLPIQVVKTLPRLEHSFWVNIIGRGYPIPNNSFRWCTDKLKIIPTSRFIKEQIDENGSAIILIGTRIDESASRAKSIEKYSYKDKRLIDHPSHSNVFIYSPIKNLLLEEVWYLLNTMQSPWGAENRDLFQIYADASADDYECPTMVTSDKHKSCGNSRFGCWVCTVVQKDKSMESLIDNGFDWLNPLLDFRNDLMEERNQIENRMPMRRNGQPAPNYMGTYTDDYRARILNRLLNVEKNIQQHSHDIELITNQELVAIQVIWYRDFLFNHKVSSIYNHVYGKEIDMKEHNDRLEKEELLLKKVCQNSPKDFELIQELLTLQKNKSLLNRKRGLKDDIENRIEAYINNKKERV